VPSDLGAASQTLPAERLLAAMAPASRAVGRTRWPLPDRYDFGAVVDGRDLPQHPGEPGAPEIADDIPLRSPALWPLARQAESETPWPLEWGFSAAC